MSSFNEIEAKEAWGGLRRLTYLMSLIPVMEAIDKLRRSVKLRNRRYHKSINDLRYWKHERECNEQNQRIMNLLKQKQNGT